VKKYRRMKSEGSRILITGGAGFFLETHLAERLRSGKQRSFCLITFDVTHFGGPPLLARDQNVSQISGDVLDVFVPRRSSARKLIP